ncbi:MAG: hypothetical protein K2L66_03755 [Paramuribaculum sp.]|nr:hypothetical protein [Paramuribaculum sp.]
MIGLRHILPLAAAMAVGACTDRHEHISAVYESDGCLVSLTGITEADGSVWTPDDSLAAASPLASPSPLINAVFADGVSRFGMMLASDSSGGGLEADMAVAVGGSLLDPDGAVAMLRRQAGQTDFGGWPLSEGALLWIPAAWSAFCATSDTVWLREAYGVAQDIIARSLEVGWDPSLGLLRGSMPAWRVEQQLPYPRWADAVRRFESVSLTANVALAEAIAALERMRAVADAGGECPAVGASYVGRRVNSLLWDPARGRYSAYLYGGVMMDLQAPVADNIGQAMAMIWDVASEPMVSSVLTRTKYLRGMVPDMYPLMAGMRVEAAFAGAPMMQTLWAMAAAMAAREEPLLAAIASLCRLHASDPDSGASSWLALLMIRVVMGIGLQPGAIGFHPSVPQCLGDGISLKGLRYGDAVVDVAIKGFGNRVARFEIDGVPSVTYCIADSLSGYHKVEILMANNTMAEGGGVDGGSEWCPPTPEVVWRSMSSGRIADYSASLDYYMVVNGLRDVILTSPEVSVVGLASASVVAVVGVDSDGLPGFCSAPRFCVPRGAVSRYEVEECNRPGTDLVRDRRTSRRYVESGRGGLAEITVTATESDEVDCLIDICYANGNGPAGLPSATALRRVTVNGEDAGMVVMPPRGGGWWLSTGYSSSVRARLRKGSNDIVLSVVDNLEGSSTSDLVLVDNIRVIRLTDESLLQ